MAQQLGTQCHRGYTGKEQGCGGTRGGKESLGMEVRENRVSKGGSTADTVGYIVL